MICLGGFANLKLLVGRHFSLRKLLRSEQNPKFTAFPVVYKINDWQESLGTYEVKSLLEGSTNQHVLNLAQHQSIQYTIQYKK